MPACDPQHPAASPRARLQAALRGEPADRVATGPLAVHYCAANAGVSLDRYTSDAATLAECVIRYHDRFRPDAVWLSADTWVSAQAMGAPVGAVSADQPWGSLGPPCVATARDLDRIPPPDCGSQGRYPLMLDALQRIVRVLGRDACVVACFDQYPFSLAAALMGLEPLMLRLDDDPVFVEAVMERCLEYALAYGRALSEAGADMLSGGDSPAGLVGPRRYRQCALPFERRLVTALKHATSRPVSLHICGNATPILPDMAQTGADVLELDHQVDLASACDIVGPGTVLWGNLDPVGLLAQGTAEAVHAAACDAIDATRGRGHHRFVLSSGCTLALETPPDNLNAMLRASSHA